MTCVRIGTLLGDKKRVGGGGGGTIVTVNNYLIEQLCKLSLVT